MDECRHCGQLIAPGDRFCSGCGSAVPGTDSGSRAPGLAEIRLFDSDEHCPTCGHSLDATGSCPECKPAPARTSSMSPTGPALAGIVLAGALSFSFAFWLSRSNGSPAPSPAHPITEARSPAASATEESETPTPISSAGEEAALEAPTELAETPDPEPDADASEEPETEPDPAPDRLPASELPTSPASPPPPPSPTIKGASASSAPILLPRTVPPAAAPAPPSALRPSQAPRSTLPTLPRTATPNSTEDVAPAPATGGSAFRSPEGPGRFAPSVSPSAQDVAGTLEDEAMASSRAMARDAVRATRLASLEEEARRHEGEDHLAALCETSAEILTLASDHPDARSWSEHCPEWIGELLEERREILDGLIEELVELVEDEELDDALDLFTEAARPTTSRTLENLFENWEDPVLALEVVDLVPDDEGATFELRLRLIAEPEDGGDETVVDERTWTGRIRDELFATPWSNGY